MTGFNWTYSHLLSFYKSRGITELNPIIEQLLLACPSASVFGIGGHSVVLHISSNIVAKVPIKAGEGTLQQEQKVFQLLHDAASHYIVQCFYHGVDVSFLEHLPHGILHERIELPKPRPVLEWMFQLTTAVARLEELGYAHGDLNPTNIMVTGDDELRLIDFDHSLEFGQPVDVGYEPYVRLFRNNTGGMYGNAGPKTEQFALGSIFWYMFRGTQVYAELDGYTVVNSLLDGIFPTINPAEPIERVIQNCWHGHYARIADLLEEIKAMGGHAASEEKKKHCALGQHVSENSRICENIYTSLPAVKALQGKKGERNGVDA
ncbi:hypothetical protein E4U41_006596 [Claviceps citrina]|nr:hypothetical protein E4U41_006596 [Claviceps citrina]